MNNYNLSYKVNLLVKILFLHTINMSYYSVSAQAGTFSPIGALNCEFI